METTLRSTLAASLLAVALPAVAEGDVLVHRFTLAPQQEWASVSIELSPRGWRVGSPDGAPASDEQLRALLANLGAIEIGGRCASWVDGSTVYPCGFVVELTAFGRALAEPHPTVAFDAQPPGADRAQEAAQAPKAPRRSAAVGPALTAPSFVAVQLRPGGEPLAALGRRIEFRVRALSNPLVPLPVERASGLVILRPGAAKGDRA